MYTFTADREEGWDLGDHETREAALDEARERHPGETVYTGKKGPPDYPCIDADEVIDRLREAAGDQFGDFTDEWMDKATEEQIEDLGKMLQATFDAWMGRYDHKPRWFSVVEIEKHEPEEDK